MKLISCLSACVILVFALVAVEKRRTDPPIPKGFFVTPPTTTGLLLTNTRVVSIGQEGRIQPRQIRVGPEVTNGMFTVFVCTNVFQFQWPTQPGTNYQVECSHDLKVWVPTDVTWEGTGQLETWLAPLDSSRMFFRVRANK